MSLLNSINCITDAGNTGVGQCFFDPTKIAGAFLTPKGFTIPASALADSAALLAFLQAATAADNKAERIYPIMNFVQVEDNSSGMQKQTFQYGDEAPVRDGINSWTYQFRKGGLSLLQKLRLFNKSTAYDFLFFDDKNTIIGTQGLDNTNAAGVKAIPSMYFWAHQWKANTGAAVAEYKVEFAFLPQYINEYVAWAEAGVDIMSNVSGLIDVTLAGVSGGSSGVFEIEAVGGGANLGDLYDDVLNDASLWTAKNTATGAAITISGVTYDATDKRFVLTLATTAPPYPASGTITFNLAAPSVLAAAGVVGYESAGSIAITRN